MKTNKKRLFLVLSIILLFLLFLVVTLYILRRKAIAVHIAVHKGDTYKIKKLLENNPHLVNARDQRGLTPLHYAAWNKQLEAVELLVEFDADIHAAIQKMAPIHFAVRGGNINIVKFLLDKGADASMKGFINMTPLHYAATRGRKEIAELLIQRGAVVNARDEQNTIPLHYAAYGGYLDVVKLLIEKGADINAKSDAPVTGNTPLHVAIYEGHHKVIRYLLSKGADVNSTTFDKRTALHYAADRNDVNSVKILIQNGVDLASIAYGQTPLEIAEEKGFVDIVDLLKKASREP